MLSRLRRTKVNPPLISTGREALALEVRSGSLTPHPSFRLRPPSRIEHSAQTPDPRRRRRVVSVMGKKAEEESDVSDVDVDEDEAEEEYAQKSIGGKKERVVVMAAPISRGITGKTLSKKIHLEETNISQNSMDAIAN